MDGRSDLFSVGCMLFELAAGRRPFHSDNLMAIFYKITHEEANFDLIPQGADYDALMPVLKKALAKNLDERYQTAVRVRGRPARVAEGARHDRLLAERARGARRPRGADPRAGGDDRGPGVAGEGGATVDLGPGRRPTAARKGTLAPTRAGGKTVRRGRRRRDDAARARRA